MNSLPRTELYVIRLGELERREEKGGRRREIWNSDVWVEEGVAPTSLS